MTDKSLSECKASENRCCPKRRDRIALVGSALPLPLRRWKPVRTTGGYFVANIRSTLGKKLNVTTEHWGCPIRHLPKACLKSRGGAYQIWFRCLKPVGAKSRHDNFDNFDAGGMFEASPGVSRCMFEAALELVVFVMFEAGGMFEAARHGSHQTSRHVWNHQKRHFWHFLTNSTQVIILLIKLQRI